MFQEIASESGDDGYESEIDVEQAMRGLKCPLLTAVNVKSGFYREAGHK